jgi:phosphoribosylanthranilate isomerase
MFRVKICGITNVDDAVTAVGAGADAIGLNFYKKSPRFTSVASASEIIDVARDLAIELFEADSPRAKAPYAVGVFVNHPISEVLKTSHDAKLSLAQLHGDESPSDFEGLGRVGVVRVIRFVNHTLDTIGNDLAQCRQAASRAPDPKFANPYGVLVDAAVPGQYGGTGATVPWSVLADHKRWLGDTPLILAGGLTPDNVAEAIRIVRPAAVDVASGVESAPGKKDPVKVRDFVANALGAFEALSGT